MEVVVVGGVLGRRRGKGRPTFHSVSLSFPLLCFPVSECQGLDAYACLRFALHKRKHACLLGVGHVYVNCVVFRSTVKGGRFWGRLI